MSLKRQRETDCDYARKVAQRKVKQCRTDVYESIVRKVARSIHPEDVSCKPTDDTLAKIRTCIQDLSVPQRRRILAKKDSLPFHADVLHCFSESRRTTPEEESLFMEVSKRAKGMKRDEFLSSLHHLRTLRGDNTPCALKDLGNLSLVDAAQFCVQHGRVSSRRKHLLEATGFTQDLHQQLNEYKFCKNAFEGAWSDNIYFRLTKRLGNLAHAFRTRTAQELISMVKPKKLLIPFAKIFGAHEVAKQLETTSNSQKFASLGEWHRQLLETFRTQETNRAARKSSFPARYVNNLVKQFAHFGLFVSQCCGPQHMHDFLKSATSTQLRDLLRSYVQNVKSQNFRVKSKLGSHQGFHCACMVLRFLKGALRAFVTCDLDSLTAQDLIAGIENTRIPANSCVRRTFTDQEMDAMVSAAKDPAEMLLVTLLREIGLRSSALAHLTYDMLFEHDHRPKTECRVPEKGKTLRCFVTSDFLRAKMSELSVFLRKMHPDLDLSKCYVLNLANLHKPCSTIDYTVRRLAKDANITGVKVHAHAFRHTLVGKLVKAGNSLEIVSKFLGHANVNTTSFFYWVPTAQEVQAQIINPFAPSYEPQKDAVVREERLTPLVVQVANAKLNAMRKIIGSILKECDSDTKLRIAQNMPDLIDVLDAIDTPFTIE